MVWARLKVVDCTGMPLNDAKGREDERLFNINEVQWWIGHGEFSELQFASHDPVYVVISDKGMEHLTGSSGGYAGER